MKNLVKISVSVKEQTETTDWQILRKKGYPLDQVEFTCMNEEGLRIESNDGETFAFEIKKDEAIHLSKQILSAFKE
jgi:hypothetical protein